MILSSQHNNRASRVSRFFACHRFRVVFRWVPRHVLLHVVRRFHCEGDGRPPTCKNFPANPMIRAGVHTNRRRQSSQCETKRCETKHGRGVKWGELDIKRSQMRGRGSRSIMRMFQTFSRVSFIESVQAGCRWQVVSEGRLL